MSIKVKILNVNQILRKIERVMKDDLKGSGVFEDIKNFTVLRIQAETRKGNDLTGSSDLASAKRQPSLSPAYKGFRKKLAQGKVSEDHPWWFEPDPTFMRPDKSNLTATGQLLDSLSGRVNKSTNEIIVTPTGTRDQTKQAKGGFSTNVALAKDLAERGRTFLGLDALGVKRIKKFILDEIRRIKKQRGFK